MGRRAVFLVGLAFAACVFAISGAPASPKGEWKYRNTRLIGNCSFEQSMCGWTNLKRSSKNSFNFDWKRQRYSTPSSGTGPKNGATGTYFMYIESSSPRKPGDEAALSNGPYDGVMCMSFSYHMFGENIASLEIFVDDRSEFGEKVSLWKKSGNLGNKWRRDNVTIYGKSFYVMFVGEVGNGYRGDIAIDNIIFADKTCNGENPEKLMAKFAGPPANVTIAKGTCDFNKNTFCDWSNEKFTDKFDWRITKGRTGTSATGPPGDHTGRQGYYAFIESSSPRRPGDTARLVSPIVCGRVCLRFYYNMYGTGTGALAVYRREGYGATEKWDRVWQRLGDQGAAWRRDMVELNSDQQCYKVVIEATRGSTYLGDTAIDGILVREGSCCKIRSELNLLEKNGNCDFEKGFCGWKNAVRDDFNWKLTKTSTPSKQTGPSKYNGGYIYMEASEPRVQGDSAVLVSGILYGSLCMRFKYNMNGKTTGALRVYRNGDGVYQELLWQRKGHQGDVWRNAAVSIDCSVKAYFIELEAVRGSDWRGDIAVDEIEFSNGKCPSFGSDPDIPMTTLPPTTPTQLVVLDYEGFCDFNNGFCFWENDINDKGDWTQHKGETVSKKTGPREGYGGGTFIYVEASELKAGDVARLVLNAPLRGEVCLKMMYHMNGAGMGNLTVDMKERAGDGWKVVWNQTGDMGDLWREAIVSIKGNDYVISIAATRGPTFESDFALDSLEVHRGKCGGGDQGSKISAAKVLSQYNCNFEKCTERKCRDGDNIMGCLWKAGREVYDWRTRRTQREWEFIKGQTQSTYTGPMKAAEGAMYGYLEASSPAAMNDFARLFLTIEVDTSLCMRFFYHMQGSNMGSLSVYTIEPKDAARKRRVIWQVRGQPRKDPTKWQTFQQSFKVTKGETIVIEAVRGNGYYSDIAVDDIRFSQEAYCSALNLGKWTRLVNRQ
ncbi:MAM and LDL-receptor class A domain-containing protein 1 [Nematostella vectensis]|uniref:MAM and LDL-receptor class A domain-containing protein 1 n=1 Tax=Nematostella vectensis TaxID=45351 RepID=UPI0020773AC1|nr:MAM and LDL-receptor class A domain-containing protein 1 [Nematostella vectensis]